MKGMLGKLGLALVIALPVAPASAGTVYKCIGGDGVPSYVSKRPAGASCTTVGQFRGGTPRAASRPRPAAASVAKAEPPASVAKALAPAAVPVATSAAALAPSGPLPATAAALAPKAITPVPVAVTTPPRRVVSGQVYSYMKDGVRHYTSARPAQTASIQGLRTIRYSYIETCYACGLNPGVNFGAVRLNTNAYASEIAAAAREYGVEEAVVRAIIHAESAYNPTALSRAGAQGLMQLMPATARRFGVSDSFDASQNIRGGVQYLSWLLKRFNGNLQLAAAGYNAGEGAVDRHGGVPPYSETQRYVQRVGVLAERYRGAMASAQ
ncbi:lytic transglycosylase domain-containing protein [Stenotrophomonas sp. HITSZ_GD]|uniref:lytic transglycosylase domain-containing protein n=1 Tax=Stenotrophomonas sp. HITSZ_GD TaxID=3037248 RepID=UPI00240DAB30|nr:lytic transglycosylase domain-containing protein [Stenotrophomonas sp. HITSZ_GD]MDG2526183.1 lytic transglycosylase domain-containing protein [Stenotrophomonas sp. HITSZ_GD]